MIQKLLIALVVSVSASFMLYANDLNTDDDEKLDMTPVFSIYDGLIITGGQPSRDDVYALKKQGLDVIINMRTKREYDQGIIKRASLNNRIKHIDFPVPGLGGLTKDMAAQLHRLLEKNKGKKILLHCASANRAGSLLAMRAYFFEGKSIKEAMTVGTSAGMKGYRVAVKNILEQHAREKKSK